MQTSLVAADQTALTTAEQGLTVVIPAYNESGGIAPVLDTLKTTLRALQPPVPFEILVVDDGSTDDTADQVAPFEDEQLHLIRHAENRGYGAALKTGTHHARFPWVAIMDADGTYPASFLSILLELRDGADMVVGSRDGPTSHIPLIRRPPKWVLRTLASYLCGRRIPDLNSGLRIMRKSVVERFDHILPNQFSFTTTITLAMLSAGYEVRYTPIDYLKRSGRSKIRPIADTINFFTLIIRTIMFFNPLRVFLPVSFGFMAASVLVAVGSIALTGQLMDVTTVLLFVTGVQLLATGMLADLMVRKSS